MNRILAIFGRDFKSYYFSFMAYIVITIFLLLAGFFFSTSMSYFSFYSFQAASQPYFAQQQGGLNLTEMVLSGLFFNISIVLLLLMPILTMRLIAEEYREGTLEILLTCPVKESEVIIGKFLAAFTVYLTMLLPTLIHIVLLKAVGGVFDNGVVFAAYLGLILLGGAFLAFGLFSSTLTENQIVSATLSVGFLLLFWMIAWVSDLLPGALGQALSALSLVGHIEDFFKGVIELRHVLYYLLFTAYFLTLAVWRLEQRKWVK